MFLGALLTIAALVALYWKFGAGFRQAMLGYDIVVDVTVTSLFILMFAGTISGMMIAIIAGLLVSLLLLAGKYFGMSRKLVFNYQGRGKFTPRWHVSVGPGYHWFHPDASSHPLHRWLFRVRATS